MMKVGAENACRRFSDSGWTANDGPGMGTFKDNCMMLDGMSGPFLVSKFSYPFAIWDMNVEGAQWASLASNHFEQAEALTRRVPEQLDNYIASVPVEMRNDSASIGLSTPSFSQIAQCAIDYCDTFPVCNYSNVPDLDCLTGMYLVKDPMLQHSSSSRRRSSSNNNVVANGENSYFGGLPWVCHSIWLVYRHSMDESILHDLLPLLVRATNLYMRIMVRGSDGKLHLPVTLSPEYANVPDTSFDNALFRWCLKTSIHVATELMPAITARPLQRTASDRSPPPVDISSKDVARWRQVLDDLTPPLVDPATGSLMIGENCTLHTPNKHFSHMFSMFPLGLLDWNNQTDQELWIKTLAVFKYYNDPMGESREGFTYLGMSLITSLTKPSLPAQHNSGSRTGASGSSRSDSGPGSDLSAWADYALGNITDHFFTVPQLGASTMYSDHASCGVLPGCRAGMAGPCNESPLMASLALQHMLLQSWNGRPIAIFPSVPSSW